MTIYHNLSSKEIRRQRPLWQRFLALTVTSAVIAYAILEVTL